MTGGDPIRRWGLIAALVLLVPFLWLLFQIGRPDPPPPRAVQQADTGFARERQGWLEATPEDAQWLAFADALHRQGLNDQAAATLKARVERSPRSAALWAGYGHALVLLDGGRMTPAARRAFGRAIALAPGRPGPTYMFGRVLIDSGRRTEGLARWRELLAAAPADAPWIDDLEAAIARVTGDASSSLP